MAFQDAVATFTGAEDYVDVTWTDTYTTFQIAQSVYVTDGGGVVVVNIIPKPATAFNVAVRVTTSSRFTGTVQLLAYET